MTAPPVNWSAASRRTSLSSRKPWARTYGPRRSAPPPERVLVIRLGALGDIVRSLGPFAAIRRHHRGAHITLLTTAPYAEWLAGAPFFDAVWTDERPGWTDPAGVLRLRRRLVAGRFDRVYDLQTSSRSSRYFSLFPRRARPEWSGIARGCSHPDPAPERDRLHDLERQAGQLRAAGIEAVPAADLSWTSGDLARFCLPGAFALLVPGCSPHRAVKRWPAARYGDVAADLAERGITSVVVGTEAEATLARAIAERAPIVDLIGRTSFGDLASLARSAVLAVGNDTGPVNLIAAAGCPTVALFSAASDPRLAAPPGPQVSVVHCADLDLLQSQPVLEAALALRRAGSELVT